MWVKQAGLAVVLAGLSGCVATVPPPVAPPLVAIPGPNKTEAQFRQDDTACRALASNAAPVAPAGTQAAAAQQPGNQASDPASAYLRCMSSHANVVTQLPVARPGGPGYADLGYYDTYPLGLFADYSPFLYGGYYGFYGGCCGGFYGGGFRGGYGFGGGFRGGEGFRGEGGGFRDGGGGFRGGGGGGGGGGRR